MLTPSIGFCATPLTITGAGIPVASRRVGTISIMWCHWVRIPPASLMRAGQDITIPCRVPPKCEATCLVHLNGVSNAATYPHMAVAWSWAFDTPFKWTKQVASHFGGTRQGMVMSWPARIKDAGGIRTQWHHMIDIVPTLLEASGIPAPVMVNGIAQRPIEGVSMAYTWDKANTDAPSARRTQYFEMFGNRAIYHDGWIAATTPPAPPWSMGLAKMPNVVNGYKWELYNIADDYSEYND